MRIVKNPDERKQEILDAAIKVFARKGYEKTSISDIAKEIGISQGLCYRYFPSKEDMYDAGIDEYATYIVNKNVWTAADSELTVKEQILNLSGKIGAYTSAEQGQSDLYELFHKEGNQRLHNELFLRVGRKLVIHVTQLLESAKEKGEISVSDPGATANFVVFGQIGIYMSNQYSKEEKTKKIQECLFEILGIN